MSQSLDPSETLNHLNHLGYRNITADQLREFQKDLQKLIRFDTRLYTTNSQQAKDNQTVPESVYERLHSKNTISSKAKAARSLKKSEKSESDKENITVGPVVHSTAENNNKPSKMWIRPKSSQSVRRGDPVALYQAYQKDWNKFKQKLPGENDHSELRWKIRTRLLGE